MSRPPEDSTSPGGLSTGDVPFLPDKDLHSEALGTMIGGYKLLEKLGEGGFGAVWAAEQREPVKRRVALKIIKLGMDTKQVVARFEAERQALAMMDHPNIARVFDAGATQLGRPYFVMELVKGVAITRYCDQVKLATHARLDLFIKVCHAIQHAHQKGIIHRDIKPSNIMITLHDGVPVPKVIDFGIAKATQAELTEKTIYTQYGQFIGTPAYMSPEQAEMSGLDIDTRSDIYSLGVLLYELLVGSTPFEAEELMQSGLDGMRKIIREREPVRPSTRLRQTSSARASSGSTRPVHGPSLASDLDWIVMKCLEKDRTRRYETANAIAMDLTRHLKNEPVVARPPSTAYRLRKAWQRNKLLCTAGAVVVIALSLGIVGLSIGVYHVGEAKHRAEQSALAATEAAKVSQEARGLAESNAAKLETTLYFDHIALAHRESIARPPNIRFAEQMLDECPSPLRNWEWHYLKRRRFADPVVLEDPGCGVVRTIAFSPDSRYLASGGGDGKVRIWDLAESRLAQALSGHSAAVVSVTFSPTNPRWIASVGADATLRLWDWQSAQELRAWPASSFFQDFGIAYSVAFSPDGKRLAAPSEEGEVRVRWIESGQDDLVLPGQERDVQSVAFSPDGRWIATGSGGGTVRLWDASSGVSYPPLGSKGPPIACVAFANGSQVLMALYYDGMVRSWDPGTRNEVSSNSLRTATGSTISYAMAIHPGGHRMATTGDHLVSVSQRDTGRPVLILPEPSGSFYSVAFSPDGHRLAASSRTGKVYVWDGTPLAETDEPSEHTFRYPGGEVWACDIAPDGKSIAAGGYNLSTPTGPVAPVLIWREPDHRPSISLPGYRIIVFSLAFDPTGRFLAASGDGAAPPVTAGAKVWDLESGREAFPLEAFEGDGRLAAVAYSPDAKWLVGGGNDRKIKSWNASTGRKGRVIGEHGNEITALTFSADGKYLASVGNDDLAKVWDAGDLASPKPAIRSFPTQCLGVLDSCAFDPSGRRLAVAADADTAVIHDLAGEDRMVRLSHPGHQPQALAFSPDGRWVASGGGDCAVRIWEAQSGALRHTLKSHIDRVVRLRFARLPGGVYLVSASLDGTVKLWNMAAIERQMGRP